MKVTPRSAAPDVFGVVTDGEEKARLVAALGHDIKAPLQILSLSLQSLSSRTFDREVQEIVQAAVSALDEVASLSDDLLDALRFGVGATKPRDEGIVLSNLFVSLKRRFARRAAIEGVDVRVVSTRIRCVADRHYLTRILANLIDNAFNHARAKRIVIAATLRGKESVLLRVADDGRGIPEAELPYVFEEWFRGSASVTEGRRGQGLGLWAVQRCVEAMGGQVCVSSVQGRGTCFEVEFPSYAERTAHDALIPSIEGAAGPARLVAVLDDDSDVLKALQTSLEGIGATVVAATDDLQFLARVMQLHRMPDLFLLDFHLGRTTIERTLKVLCGKYGDALPAIIVTGHSSAPALMAMRERMPIVQKPINAEQLGLIKAVVLGEARLTPRMFN